MLSQTNPAYKYPAIPDSIISVSDRQSYLALHYWDYAEEKDFYEPTIAESFFYILSKTSSEPKEAALKHALELSYHDYNRLSMVTFYIDFFIGTPESEYWDDELYLFSQKCIIESNVPEDFKIAPQWRIEVLSKNPLGSIGPDMQLADEQGTVTFLSKLKMPCAVIFASSDCERCKEEQELFASNIEEIRIKGWNVITVYSGDNIPTYASSINSVPYLDIGKCIEKNDLYIVRRYPSVYLFDKDFKIVGKELKLQDILNHKSHTLTTNKQM